MSPECAFVTVDQDRTGDQKISLQFTFVLDSPGVSPSQAHCQLGIPFPQLENKEVWDLFPSPKDKQLFWNIKA